jgi:hypothetical protein
MVPQFLSRCCAPHTDSGECRGFSCRARGFWEQNVLLVSIEMKPCKIRKNNFLKHGNFLWINYLVGYRISAQLVANKQKQASERELNETANLWCPIAAGRQLLVLLVAVITDACCLGCVWYSTLRIKKPSHPSHWQPKFWRILFDTSKVN